MSTRAQVAYIDEDFTSIVTTYNHYDGYPDNLGKALLNHYDSDEKAKDIASSGYISYINPETGEVDAKHKDSPTVFRGDDIDTLLRMFYDHSNQASADYVYLYAGQWIDSKMYPMTQGEFVDNMTDELKMISPSYNEDEMMEEGYEAKWKNFINEAGFKNREEVIGALVKDFKKDASSFNNTPTNKQREKFWTFNRLINYYSNEKKKSLNEGEKDVVSVASSILRDMPNLDVYIDSLKNDVRLNGAEDYYGYDSDDWEEDYDNYMADKMG